MTSAQPCRKLLVVDDHESVLGGTVSALKQAYVDADIVTATNAEDAAAQLATRMPDVLIMDLSMPQKSGSPSQTETGINLLRSVMATYPELNIVVQSSHVNTLIRVKPDIDNHLAGFTIVSKSLPIKEMLEKVDWALKEINYIPREMRTGIEVKPEWLEVLELAFFKGLQDKAIAENMNVSERTVRHYWTKVQDVLGVYPEEGKNIRIQTEIRARKEGLID